MKKLEKGKLTIGLPIFNEEQTIRKVLECIMNNIDDIDYVIISDNHSTDKTPIICKEYCENNDKFFYHENIKNIGSWQNAKKLQKRVKTEYYMQLGGHDYLSPNSIKTLKGKMDSDVVCCFPNIKNQIEEYPFEDTYIKYQDKLASEGAGDRFIAYLLAGGANRAYYGIMRMEVFKEAFSLYGQHAMYAVDIAIVAYMSLKGKLKYVPEVETVAKGSEMTYYEAIRRYRRAGMDVPYINPGKKFYQCVMQMVSGEPSLNAEICAIKKILNQHYDSYRCNLLWMLVWCKNTVLRTAKSLLFKLAGIGKNMKIEMER